MKIIGSIVLLALALAIPSGAVEPTPPTMESLNREVGDLTRQLQTAKNQIDDLLQRIDTLEKRLGDSFRPVSPFDTVERRLDDLQKDVDRLKR